MKRGWCKIMIFLKRNQVMEAFQKKTTVLLGIAQIGGAPWQSWFWHFLVLTRFSKWKSCPIYLQGRGRGGGPICTMPKRKAVLKASLTLEDSSKRWVKFHILAMVKWKWPFFSSRQGPLRLRKSGQRKRRRLGSKKLQGQQLVRAGERGAKQAESKDVKQFVKAVPFRGNSEGPWPQRRARSESERWSVRDSVLSQGWTPILSSSSSSGEGFRPVQGRTWSTSDILFKAVFKLPMRFTGYSVVVISSYVVK